VPAAACKRDNTKQFHDSKICFPLTRRLVRPTAPEYRTLFKAKRPTTAMF
jgi:large subunit ribosomal protein L18Ae